MKAWAAQVWLKFRAEECPMHAQSDPGPVVKQASLYERLSHVPDMR